MSEVIQVDGRCHCGDVHLTVTARPQFSLICHCDNCRRLNGGVRMAGISVARDALRVHGRTTSYSFASGEEEMEVHFCGRCGTPLFTYQTAFPTVVVRINTLTNQDAFPPNKALYTDQACAWDRIVSSG